MNKITRVFFVRHAQPDKAVKDDRNRPLTEKGRSVSSFVTDILKNYLLIKRAKAQIGICRKGKNDNSRF